MDSGISKRPQLSEAVATHLRQRVMSGQVRPGEFLRLEHIADELGISVTPVREALVALRGEGFVQLQPRRGFVVAPLSRQDVLDVFGIQADIAGELAARAVTAISDEQIAELEAMQARMEKLDGDPVEQEKINHEFHRLINTVSDSSKLAWFLAAAVRYAPSSFYGDITGWPQASHEDHHAILDALKVRDAEAARSSMHSHITHAGELLVKHLDSLGLWDVTSPSDSATS